MSYQRNRHGIPITDWPRIAAKTQTVAPKPELDEQPKRRKRRKLKPAPECPPWLRSEEYEQLLALRRSL